VSPEASLATASAPTALGIYQELSQVSAILVIHHQVAAGAAVAAPTTIATIAAVWGLQVIAYPPGLATTAGTLPIFSSFAIVSIGTGEIQRCRSACNRYRLAASGLAITTATAIPAIAAIATVAAGFCGPCPEGAPSQSWYRQRTQPQYHDPSHG
jgi:hypothetical protein